MGQKQNKQKKNITSLFIKCTSSYTTNESNVKRGKRATNYEY